jgi:hypothetical protein
MTLVVGGDRLWVVAQGIPSASVIVAFTVGSGALLITDEGAGSGSDIKRHVWQSGKS